MYVSLIVTFLLLMGLVVAGIQNTASFEVRFLAWSLHMSLTGIIFYASVFGGAIVAVLTLPKMLRLKLKNRSQRREARELRLRLESLERPSNRTEPSSEGRGVQDG